MLVLSRKPGERIVIGPNIVVTVVEMTAGRVKIGIEAPQEVAVHREEIHSRLSGGSIETLLPRPCESTYLPEFA